MHASHSTPSFEHVLYRRYWIHGVLVLSASALVWVVVHLYLRFLEPIPPAETLSEPLPLLQSLTAGVVVAALVLGVLMVLEFAWSLLVNAILHAFLFVGAFLLMGRFGEDPTLTAYPFATPMGIALLGSTGVLTVGSALAYSRLSMIRSAIQSGADTHGDLPEPLKAHDASDNGEDAADTAAQGAAASTLAESGSATLRSLSLEQRQRTRGAMAERVGSAFNPGPRTLLHVQDLYKHYGPIRAVDGISFTVDRGEIVGFLGPNGAGKSTTMKVLTTFIQPTSGVAKVAGFDVTREPLAVRSRLGYLPEVNPLYREMRVLSYLTFIAEARHVSPSRKRRNLEWVREACGLHPVWDMRISELSKGYRQRVGLAQAIIHEPDILILDEPSSGLDPLQIVEIRELIRDLGRDRTIILSTHIMQEVTAICSRVMIIDRGKLQANGSVAELCNALSPSGVLLARLAGSEEQAKAAQSRLDGAEGVAGLALEAVPQAANGTREWQLLVTPGDEEAASRLGRELFARCQDAGVEVREVRHDRPTLEDVFVTLTRGN